MSSAQDILASVTAFLYREAAIMDEHRYDDWLRLWHPDALYWIPIDDNAPPDRTVCIIHEHHSIPAGP